MHPNFNNPRAQSFALDLPRRRKSTIGIYIHFPYCIQKCSYCDFFSVAMQGEHVSDEALQHFESSIETELRLRMPMFGDYSVADSVYFGGGTSSLMPADTIERLLSLLQSRVRFSPDCEITLEGNPENFTAEYLASLHEIGVTRVNVGIQTFSGDALQKMNRYFNAERYNAILGDLANSPIENVGIDLIYGFPEQTVESFHEDLTKVLSVELNHLSIYSLTAEAGTPYTTSIERRQASPPNEDLQGRIFAELPELLSKHGFQQYEISNFAKVGGTCRHNLRYWLYEPYIGLGPGAHGFTGSHRYANTRNIHAWTTAPSVASYEEHEPTYDLPLNLLRLTAPFDPRIFHDVLGDRPAGNRLAEIALNLLDTWVHKGYGRWLNSDAANSLFVWNYQGYSQLNERTLEMIEGLEELN